MSNSTHLTQHNIHPTTKQKKGEKGKEEREKGKERKEKREKMERKKEGKGKGERGEIRKRGLVDFSFVAVSLLFASVLLPLFYIIYFPSTFCCLSLLLSFINPLFFTLFLRFLLSFLSFSTKFF